MKRLVCLLLLIPVLSGCAFLQPRASARTAAPGRSDSVAATPVPTSPENPGKQEALDAFREIAFTSEYTNGAGNAAREIRKWTDPIKAAVHGSPTAEDNEALKRAMDGLNALEGFPGISVSEQDKNVDIWFVPLDKMAGAVPDYVPGNWGFFTVNFSGGRITGGAIAIATDVTDQVSRNHLIFEEVLQSTGLMQDSYRYSDSIFYGRWTTVQQPTRLDWELLGMLYLPELKPGMPESDAMGVLEKKVQ